MGSPDWLGNQQYRKYTIVTVDHLRNWTTLARDSDDGIVIRRHMSYGMGIYLT